MDNYYRLIRREPFSIHPRQSLTREPPRHACCSFGATNEVLRLYRTLLSQCCVTLPGRKNFITLYPSTSSELSWDSSTGCISEASTELCSPFVGERPSHNCTTSEVRLATSFQDSGAAPSPGEMRSHVAKLVSTSATKPGAEVVLPSLRQPCTIGGDLAFQCLFSNEIKRPSNLSNYYDDVCTWPRQVDNEGTWQQKVQRLKGPAPERRDSVDRTSRTGLGIDSQVLAVVGVSFSSFHRQTCADFRTSWKREAKCNTSDAVRRTNVGWSGIYCLLTDIHSRDVRRCRKGISTRSR